MTTAWGAALDDFATFLEKAERALADGDVVEETAAWQPPAAPAGEPSAAEFARANHLLGRAAQLRPRLEAHRDAIARELTDLDRSRSAAQAYAAH
jgi:hypothetical protein